jgi:hypothetical protein
VNEYAYRIFNVFVKLTINTTYPKYKYMLHVLGLVHITYIYTCDKLYLMVNFTNTLNLTHNGMDPYNFNLKYRILVEL